MSCHAVLHVTNFFCSIETVQQIYVDLKAVLLRLTVKKTELTTGGIRCTNFADKRRSLGLYSSLAD
jgi:hypothetical protein